MDSPSLLILLEAAESMGVRTQDPGFVCRRASVLWLCMCEDVCLGLPLAPVCVQGAVGHAVLGRSALGSGNRLSTFVTSCSTQLVAINHENCFEMACSVTFWLIVHPCLLSASSDKSYKRWVVGVSCLALTFTLFDLQLFFLDEVHATHQLKRHSIVLSLQEGCESFNNKLF